MRIKTKKDDQITEAKDKRETNHLFCLNSWEYYTGVRQYSSKWIRWRNESLSWIREGKTDQERRRQAFLWSKSSLRTSWAPLPQVKKLGPFKLVGAFPRVLTETFHFPANLSLLNRENRLGIWRRGRSSNKSAGEVFVAYFASLPERSHHPTQDYLSLLGFSEVFSVQIADFRQTF